MKKYTLRNGSRVILEPMSGTSVMTLLILFKVGSRNETPKTNGISHFLEHLFFKGTENRPTTLDISQELDGVGAEFNAFTGKDYTGYYVKVDHQHASLAIDILEDLLFHPLFDSAEIERERGVIIEEINMYEDNPMAISEEFSEQLLFGAEHPLGFRIAGPPQNIREVTRNTILKYRQNYYHPENMVIIAAGNLPKDIQKQLSTHFSATPRSTKKSPTTRRFTYKQERGRFYLERKTTAQAHLALTFPAPKYTSPELPVANILSTILGGNMSARLFIQVRERKGLCYYIRSHVSPYDDTGAFTIQAGFDKTRIHEAIHAIMDELVTIRKTAVTDQELQKAKEYIRGKMSIEMEDSENVASWWGKQALFHDTVRSFDDAYKKIQAVTKEDVLRFAKNTFQSKKANLVVIGPYTNRQEQTFKKHLHF